MLCLHTKNYSGGHKVSEIQKKPFYKKWWVWVIAIIIILIIVPFGDDDDGPKPAATEANVEEKTNNETESEEQINNEAESEEKTEFGLNEPIEFEGRILEVTNVEKSSGNDFDRPKEGKEYIIVTVNITNSSDDVISYNPYDFKMQNSQGQIEDQAFTIIDSDTSLSSGELAEGGNISGTITFEQPVDDPDLRLIFEPNFWSNKQVVIHLN